MSEMRVSLLVNAEDAGAGSVIATLKREWQDLKDTISSTNVATAAAGKTAADAMGTATRAAAGADATFKKVGPSAEASFRKAGAGARSMQDMLRLTGPVIDTQNRKFAESNSLLRILRASSKGFGEGLRDGARQAWQEQEKLRNTLAKTNAELVKGGAAAKSSGGLFSTLIAGAKAFIGIAVVRTLIRMSDAFTSLSARIRISTDSQADYLAGQAEVFAVAQRTGTAVEATALLYVRLNSALRDNGASQKEILGITETVNQALAVSGASTAEAGAAVLQLSQAFASGTLRGDEFNSINEQGPRIMEALAKSLGITRGELRKMAEAGKLTADKLRGALSGSQAKLIADEFNKLPVTIGRAWRMLTNSFTFAVGKMGTESGVLTTIAGAIQSISEFIDAAVPKLMNFGSQIAGVFKDGADLVTSFYGTIDENSRQMADEVGSGLAQLGKDSLRELEILPTSIGTIFGIIIGEADKLRITIVEKFKLVALGAEGAWNGLASVTTGLGSTIKIVLGQALDFVAKAYGSLLGTISKVAGAVGLDSLAGDLSKSAASFALLATSEEQARAGAAASAQAYRDKSAALAAQADVIRTTAANERAAADDAIAGSLAMRDAALANLDVDRQAAAVSDKAGEDRTKKIVDTTALNKLAKEREKAIRDLANAERAGLDMMSQLAGETNATAKAQSDFDVGMRALEKTMVAWLKAGGDTVRVNAAWKLGEDQLRANLVKTNAEIKKRNALANGNADLVGDLAAMQARLAGATSAQLAYNAGVAEANALAKEAIALGIDQQAVADGLTDRLELLGELKDAADLSEILSSFGEASEWDKLIGNIAKVEKALEKAIGEKAVDKVKRLQRAAGDLRQEALLYATDALGAGISSLKSMASEGSQAYAAMEVAQSALNVVTAIGAILNQAKGDPYTAFARMAAMAAAVASLVGSIGSFAASGFSDTSKERQETQGTGTVLGDATAKSESILKATEITAAASQQLVGLNRGMLNALNALNNALGSAGNSLARGAGNADFSGMNLAVESKNPLGIPVSESILDPFGWLGGKSKITDQGIIIFGGALNDMLDSIAVGAYQEVQSRSWAFGSVHTNEGISPVSSEFATQFQLVINSIADTVRQGALALGLLPADVEAAMAAYQVAELRISLKDLSAEDAQKELMAVFSALFDGLAGDVVPFIAQFQQVGEGLGETLIRIATEVQVAQIAFEQLGLSVGVLDPERFAQVADGLIKASGGLDAFISGMQSFVANFSTDAHQFTVNSAALGSAFGEVGLTLPTTRAGMWDLMQSLDATTEAGQAQIATLIRLSDTANAYYDSLDKRAEDLLAATQFLGTLGLSAGGLTGFGSQLKAITADAAKAEAAYTTLRISQGLLGATSMDLARVHRWTADQIGAALRQLQAQTQDLVAQLYGGVPGTLEAINARIAALTSGGTTAIDNLSEAGNNTFAAWQTALESINDYLQSMLLNANLTTLTPEQQLAEARSQLTALAAAAAGGDAGAAAQLPQMADQFLTLLRGYFSSGDQYTEGFDWVRTLLQGVTANGNPGTAPTTGGGATYTLQPSPELVALYAARDAALAQQEATQRLALAQQLAQNLADLSAALNVPILEMIQLQGVQLGALATDLGINLDDLTAGSVQALAGMASTLGLSLTDLTGALGISLTDLSVGVTDLATRLGVDLSNLTVESTQSLVNLANSLGTSLTELQTTLGIDLGQLADSQSLLNDALEQQISALPQGQRDALQPLFDAIATATDEASASAAVQALEDAVNVLAPGIRDQLAPYFGLLTSPADPTVRELVAANVVLEDMLSALYGIDARLANGGNPAAAGTMPQYATGAANITSGGMAEIHANEAVVDAEAMGYLRAYGIRVTGSGNDGAAGEIRALRMQQADEARQNDVMLATVADRLANVERAQRDTSNELERIARNPWTRS